jgi:large subunit ribosomal protein L13
VVDATGQNLGRLSSQVAAVLRSKHKPTFTPWMDNGDFVIILNAGKIAVTGNREAAKMYYTSRVTRAVETTCAD